MTRKKRNVSAGKRKINECYHDDRSPQKSDHDDDDQKGVSKEAILDNQSSREKSSPDSFYEKLIKLNESSGLSIVFDFRETKVDLHLIYKEVTDRGGSHQVSKDGKWIEVASALSIKNHASFLPRQIQKVYENLLYQYEQIHYYRTPAKVSTLTDLSLGKGDSSQCLLREHKSFDSSSRDGQVEKRKCTADAYHASTGPGTPEKKPILQTFLDEKTIVRDPCAPPKARTSYQLFIKMECDRLRKIHGENSGSLNLRNMAIDRWRHLSQNERLPFIEASRMDKERFNRQMAFYVQHENKKVMKTENLLKGSTSTFINFGPSPPINDEYFVTLEADAGNLFLPDESLVESTIEMLKNAQPNDPIFQMNWDEYCGSPNSPHLKDHREY
ncbi:hypothetical protein ACH5RR_001648 [Cinchona calisaya]|uniref:Uncharacterized protein n=1 Tax=Cinchona calisaya TaxID=153742 RepID=A0ABD3B3Z6_9GENT